MQSAFLTTCGEMNGSLVSPSNSVEIQLNEDNIFKLSGDARGTKIQAVAGTLWVTQQNDASDYLLHTGQTLRVSYKGTILIQGFPIARVRVMSVSKSR